MRKKRKVWWLVGGVGFVVLFTVPMLVMPKDSADAKMQATLNDIAVQYGFEKQFDDWTILGGPRDLTDGYLAVGLTEVEADKILKTIEDACQNCTIGTGPWMVDGHLTIDIPSAYILDTGETYQSITSIWFVKDLRSTGPKSDDKISVDIYVRRRTPPFWERVREWLPW